MKKFVLFLVATFAMAACNDKDDRIVTNAPSVDNKMIIGEWVATNPSQDKFTDIMLSDNQRVNMLLIQKGVGKNAVYKEDEGSWTTENGSILSFTMYGNNIPQHKIVEINENYMQLRNLKYNTLDTYYHVIETVKLNVGTNSPIKRLEGRTDLGTVKIASLNTDVATVSQDGIIKAIQGGTAFISLDTENSIEYVKVIVESRIEVYSQEVKLNIEDIVNKYGQPDKKYQVKNNNLNMYEYLKTVFDEGISTTQYYYDKQSHEIAKIVTKYKSPSDLKSDLDYLNEYYYSSLHYNSSSNSYYTFYGKSKYRYENSVLVYYDNEETGQFEGMHYTNNDYFSDNVDIGDPTKETDNELYLEPYKEWGGSVSDVKSHMSNFVITHDIQLLGGNFYSMEFKGKDYKGNDIYYQYDFKYSTYGLIRVWLYLDSNNVTYEDIKEHLRSCGYHYEFSDTDFPGGVYTIEFQNGHTTVGINMKDEKWIQVVYLFTN